MSNSTEMPKKKRKRRTADVPLFTDLDPTMQQLITVSLRRLCKRAVDDIDAEKDGALERETESRWGQDAKPSRHPSR